MSRPKPLTEAELARHPLPPITGGDKDSHGCILIVAGSRSVPGAALLAAHAAMRSGAGKLQITVPDAITIPLGLAMPEAMVIGYPTARDGGFSPRCVKEIASRADKVDAIVAGPGMTGNTAVGQLAAALLATGVPAAFDAALLHALPSRDREARSADQSLILLPHAGEMASLIDCNTEEVEADPLRCGRICAARYDALVLVKGVQSHIVAPDGRSWLYKGGGPGLGASGSGDVLAGIVGGLLARGATALSTLLWAVWLHGEAGRRLGERIGTTGYLARELSAEIPALLSARR